LGPNEGFLYPLNRCFFFLPKPTCTIRYANISVIKFSRINNSITTFGIEIHTTGNMNKKLAKGGVFSFENILKEEFDCLHQFIKSKEIRFEADETNATTSSLPVEHDEKGEEKTSAKTTTGPQENSEEDSSFSSGGESEHDELEFQEGDAVEEGTAPAHPKKKRKGDEKSGEKSKKSKSSKNDTEKAEKTTETSEK